MGEAGMGADGEAPRLSMVEAARTMPCGPPGHNREFSMPIPTLARLCLRLMPLVVAPVTLSGCGEPSDQFPPPCPMTSILGDAADLTRYRGTGQDLTDMVLSGRITGLSGSCKRAANGSVVLTTLNIGLDLTRGPAAPGRLASTAFFVALTRGDTILAKQVYPLHARFPPNTDRIRLTGDEVQVQVPNKGKEGAAAYRVIVGFELTPQELATNRRRSAQ